MDAKLKKQMAKMVDAVQPHCDEKIVAAMTCSHAGSMGTGLLTKILLGFGVMTRSSNLPNPVFIAVGTDTIYAFNYKPRGFNFKIKKLAARWPKNEVMVAHEEGGMMTKLFLTMKSGETYPLEMATMMGGKELVHMFIEALGG